MFKIQKRIIYAIEAVLDIALNAGVNPVQNVAVAKRQGIPKRYLEQTLQILVKNNIFFAGIDFVDGYLIGDINVTSPTGLPQYKILTGINLAEYFWDELEKLK